MVSVNILIGRILRDCALDREGMADYGSVVFRVSKRYSRIAMTNRAKDTAHILLPHKAGCHMLHIASRETVEYELADFLAHSWRGTVELVFSSNVIPFSSNALELDFFKAQIVAEGVKVLSNAYEMERLLWLQLSTDRGQADTVYRGEVCLDKEVIFPVDWSKLCLEDEGVRTIRFMGGFDKDNKQKEGKKMGFFSALLSGGILIGKICQGISSALSSMVADEQNGLMVSTNNLKFDDVSFLMAKGEGDQEAKLYALNCCADTKAIQFPPDASGNSLMCELPAMSKVPIGTQVQQANPTDVIEISTMEDVAQLAKNGKSPSAKILLNNLKIGDSGSQVFVYGFSFQADIGGIWIGGGSVSSVEYLSMTAKSGISLLYDDKIESGSTGEKGKLFPIDWNAYGLGVGDVLSGELHFSYAANSVPARNLIPAEPLTSAEKAFFLRQGILRDD